MLRGSGEAEKQLKNAKTEFFNEAEEIATYTAIEALAETVGDKDTAKLARTIRREEERMAGYLEKLIPTLSRAVAQEEIPPPSAATARRATAPAPARRARGPARGPGPAPPPAPSAPHRAHRCGILAARCAW